MPRHNTRRQLTLALIRARTLILTRLMGMTRTRQLILYLRRYPRLRTPGPSDRSQEAHQVDLTSLYLTGAVLLRPRTLGRLPLSERTPTDRVAICFRYLLHVCFADTCFVLFLLCMTWLPYPTLVK